MKIFNRLSDQFKKVQPLPEGLYHLQAEGKPLRVHLRLRKDGTGLLILNASTVLHLNPTAAEYAYHFIKGSTPEDTAKEIAGRYRIPRVQALEDYTDFSDRIQALIETPDLDPVTFLDFERVAPHSADLTAPLRLDCALDLPRPQGDQTGRGTHEAGAQGIDDRGMADGARQGVAGGHPARHIHGRRTHPARRPARPDRARRKIGDGVRSADGWQLALEEEIS